MGTDATVFGSFVLIDRAIVFVNEFDLNRGLVDLKVYPVLVDDFYSNRSLVDLKVEFNPLMMEELHL